MKTFFKIIGALFGLLVLAVVAILFLGRGSMEKHNQAQALADNIIENLDSDNIYDEFPEKYFPKADIYPIVAGIVQNCDWPKRDGKFVDFFSQKNIGGTDYTSFIYEYYMSCDSIRFIVTVAMEEELEVAGFRVEPLEQENPMILFPEKQLKNR